jgi:hypothetical protein
MNIWEIVERVLKIAGICGGLAAGLGVWLQLDDMNRRERQGQIDDWQSSIVYQIIDDGHRLDLKRISELYVNEAQKLPIALPRDKLSDSQLRLVLLRLMQRGLISESNNEYTLYDYESKSAYLAEYLEYINLTARHVNLAREVLADAYSPLTRDQLRTKIISVGGDAKYITNNFDYLLEQLQTNRVAILLNDGRVARFIEVPPIQPPLQPPLPAPRGGKKSY